MEVALVQAVDESR